MQICALRMDNHHSWQHHLMATIHVLIAYLKKGAEVKKCDQNGFSPLFVAAFVGNRACVDSLLRKGMENLLNRRKAYRVIPLD